MLFEYARTALYRVVLTVIGRIVDKVNRLANLVDPLHHPMKELSPDTAIFWPVIDLDLQVRNLLLRARSKFTPPGLQSVNNKIARFVRTAKANEQCLRILIHNATGNIALFCYPYHGHQAYRSLESGHLLISSLTQRWLYSLSSAVWLTSPELGCPENGCFKN